MIDHLNKNMSASIKILAYTWMKTQKNIKQGNRRGMRKSTLPGLFIFSRHLGQFGKKKQKLRFSYGIELSTYNEIKVSLQHWSLADLCTSELQKMKKQFLHKLFYMDLLFVNLLKLFLNLRNSDKLQVKNEKYYVINNFKNLHKIHVINRVICCIILCHLFFVWFICVLKTDWQLGDPRRV